MKKLITVATFLTTTTVLANAATVLTLDSAAVSSAGGTYSLSTAAGSDSSYGGFSVSVVFDINQLKTMFSSFSNAKSIFYANGDGSSGTYNIGFAYNYYSSSSQAGFFGQWQSGIARTFTSPEGQETNISTGLKDIITSTDAPITAAAATMTVSSGGTVLYLTLQKSDGTTEDLYGTDTELKAANFGKLSTMTWSSGLVSYVTVDDTTLDSTSAYSQNKTNINASIPEPSSFGLLAGTLALAFVASRRKRVR